MSMEVFFEPEELGKLVTFLDRGFGRIAAAVVPGPAAGDALIEHLKRQLGSSRVVIAGEHLEPVALSDLAREAGNEGRLLVVPLDRRRRLSKPSEEERFWRELNYQREHLAHNKVRTLFLLDDVSDRYLTLVADDLREWVRMFRFPEARLSHLGLEPLGESLAPRDARTAEPEVHSEQNLRILRDQLRRARELGLPEAEIARSYAVPLFVLLVERGLPGEARRLWEHDLRGGDALPSLRIPRDTSLLITRIRLAELEGKGTDREELTREYLRAAEEADEESYSPRTLRALLDALYRRGRALHAINRLEEAKECFQRGLALVDQKRARIPGNGARLRGRSLFLWGCGTVLEELGDHDQAEAIYRESIDILRRLTSNESGAVDWRRELAVHLNSLGRFLQAQGRLQDAETCHRESLGIARELQHRNPENLVWRRDVAVAVERLGDVLHEEGRLRESLAAYEERLEIARKLLERDPKNMGWQRDLGVVLGRLGLVYEELGRLSDARKVYMESLSLVQRVLDQDPENPDRREDLIVSVEHLAAVLTQLGRVSEARELFEKQERFFRQRLVEKPKDPWLRQDLGLLLTRFADLLRGMGELGAARARYEEALGIARALAASEPGHPSWRKDLVVALNRLASSLREEGRLVEARELYDESLKLAEKLAALKPENPTWRRHLVSAHGVLAGLLADLGQIEEARKEYRESLELGLTLDRIASTDIVNLAASVGNLERLLRERGRSKTDRESELLRAAQERVGLRPVASEARPQ